MIGYQDIVGNQEDWANFVTNVEMLKTPFMDWLPVGDTPVNTEYLYQAEKYRDARENRHVDGKPWTTFANAGDSRASLRSLIQWFDFTTSVSKLHQDVSNVAGIEDELAHDITKCLKEMAWDMEVAFLENNDCVVDNSTQGYRTRAVGSWISSSAQSLYPVDENFRPAAAQCVTTATTSMTGADVIAILQAIGRVTKQRQGVTAFVGEKFKGAINNWPQFTIGSHLAAGTQTAAGGGLSYTKPLADREVGALIEKINTDAGPVDLIVHYGLHGLDGSSTTQQWAAYFLHQDKWELRWKQKPTVYRLPFLGGSYEAAGDTIAMLVCKNPQAEASYTPTA